VSTSENEIQDVPVASLGYADAAAELDTIIRELDQGLIDVDLLESRFRRAIEIVEELDRRIHGARQRVDELLPRLSRVVETDGASSETP
jgi:exodeoxyribonuclease VII small subunit